MDFRQIEAFVKVVELCSFSRAAEEMHISQPSVSNYISALEKELDTVLINRSTKVLSTTLAGERFLEQAKKMISLKRTSTEMLKNLTTDISGEIRILASSVPANYILPPILAQFHKLYPNVFFAMSQVDTAEVVAGIAAHKADIGFVGSKINNKKCDFIPFANDKLVLIAANDGYYKSKEFSLDAIFYSKNFISRECGSGTRIQYEKFLTENGIDIEKVKFCADIDNTYSIINAVASGFGISIVSELAARQMIERKNLISIKLKQELPERKIYMTLNKNIAHSHLVKLFMENARHFNLRE